MSGANAADANAADAGKADRPVRHGPDRLLVDSDAHVFVDDLDLPALDETDLHHLSRVLRLRPGTSITVSDGQGRWRPARFTGLTHADIDGETRIEPSVAAGVTIGFSLLKGDRNELVVQKLTEIGAECIVPMTTQRTIVHWDAARASHQISRLRRVAREAAMQSRRVFLPIIEDLTPFERAAVREGAALAVAGSTPLGPETTTVLVGPEGGWSPSELGFGMPRVGLGPNILRAETGSIVACALLVAFLTGQVTPAP